MIVEAIVSMCSLGLCLFFYDRHLTRKHDAKLTHELAAETRACVESVGHLRTTLVETLKNMREIVKDTEAERKRTAAVATGTLLRPGRKLPQP